MKLGPYDLDTIYTGDARELAKAIPDESIDLIFTDPVYQNIDDYRWLAETAARILKPNKVCLVWHGTKFLDLVLAAMTTSLDYKWQFVTTRPMGFPSSFVLPRVLGNWRSCLWFEKGKSLPSKVISDLNHASTSGGLNFAWNKDPRPSKAWVIGFSQPNDIVLDPFCGGGTVPAACKMLGRHWLGFEIDPQVAERARLRVEQTQPPLFVEPTEQGMLPLD